MRNEFVPFQNELFPDSYTKLSFSSGTSINDVVSKSVILDPPSPPAPAFFLKWSSIFLAESFYNVKYWTSIITSNVRQINLSKNRVLG